MWCTRLNRAHPRLHRVGSRQARGTAEHCVVQTRKVIGRAISILVERPGLTEDRAFEYLTRVSSHTNVKLREVAKEVPARRNDESRNQDAPPPKTR